MNVADPSLVAQVAERLHVVRSRIVAARNGGTAVLLISEDLDEILELSDRIVVMREGQIVYEVDGKTAEVKYAGSAPGSIYGVMQVNIQIPANAQPGSAVPLVINVGGNNSQQNVTIAIQ